MPTWPGRLSRRRRWTKRRREHPERRADLSRGRWAWGGEFGRVRRTEAKQRQCEREIEFENKPSRGAGRMRVLVRVARGIGSASAAATACRCSPLRRIHAAGPVSTNELTATNGAGPGAAGAAPLRQPSLRSFVMRAVWTHPAKKLLPAASRPSPRGKSSGGFSTGAAAEGLVGDARGVEVERGELR